MASKPVGMGFLTFTLDDVKDFNTASNGILTTTVITKHPVTIEFFLGLKYRTKLIGSDVPGKDLIIGFDIYRQLRDRLQLKANGIAFKKQSNLILIFQGYSKSPTTKRNFTEQNLTEHSCVESHRDFMKKRKCPLWKNE
uniref:Uncharacterized protein LOC104235369 n=1 Tax=Nicotiana sylvestris TaxID=4096 RepID=A0A1U7XCM9_NICSY|nr:PREDICTED: uncharacterized protein LOC104235369 [Nicotiana sylvestris]